MKRPSWFSALLMSVLSTSASAASPAAAAPAGPAATPEARVRAFIADYERIHSRAAKIIDAGDFDAWEQLIAGLDAAHFVAGRRSGLGEVMSGRPEHHPEHEKITASLPQGELVLLRTENESAPITRYYEYDLRRIGEDWRIVQLRGYVRSPDAPFVEAKEQARFRAPKEHPYRALPGEESALDGGALFAQGRHVEVGKNAGSIDVRRVGMLHVTSGVLVVGDLGYDAATLGPLGRRIAPGRYPVDVSIAFERVAALRVLVSDRPVVRWHPADMGEEGGHVVGVDAGNVAIADASALLEITSRHKEKEFEKFAQSGSAAAATLLALASPDDCAIASSGYGDGAYPVYWGVDAAGNPAVLLVDMMVLSSE